MRCDTDTDTDIIARGFSAIDYAMRYRYRYQYYRPRLFHNRLCDAIPIPIPILSPKAFPQSIMRCDTDTDTDIIAWGFSTIDYVMRYRYRYRYYCLRLFHNRLCDAIPIPILSPTKAIQQSTIWFDIGKIAKMWSIKLSIHSCMSRPNGSGFQRFELQFNIPYNLTSF